MRTRSLCPALTGIAIAITVALAGCTNTPEDSSEPTGDHGSDVAAPFLTCLTSSGLEARINDAGQVLVKHGATHADGSFSSGSEGGFGHGTESGTGGGEALLIESDGAGSLWVAAADADYFADDPGTQDAYASCERQHPDFTQPQSSPDTDQELEAELEDAALAFARCAREHGFTQIADPDTGGAIMIPDDFTEDDFRALLESCYDPTAGFGFGTSENATFEPWPILDEFAHAPAS